MKNTAKIFASNSLWSLLNQGARVGSLAVVTILLSRHFGPQRFGVLAFGLAFVRIFAVIAVFGLDRILVREIAQGGDRARILRGAFRLKFAIAFASYLALLGLVWLVDGQDRQILTIVGLAGVGLLFQPCDVFDYAFQAGNRFGLTFLGRGLPLMISAAIKIGALFAGAPLLVFALLETLEAALIGGALLVIHWKTGRPEPKSNGLEIPWRPFLSKGFPLLLSSLAVMIYMRTDVLMLGKMAGYEAAGVYSAAAQISEGSTLVAAALLPALFPILLRWRISGLVFYRRQFEKLFLVAIIAGILVAGLLTIFAQDLISVLFGQAFLPATSVLRILAWSPIFVFLGVTQSGYDITEGLTWRATLRTALGASINVTLNYFLIPGYGPVGAATATVVSFGCSAFLLNLAQRATRPVFALQLRAMLLFPIFLRPLRYE